MITYINKTYCLFFDIGGSKDLNLKTLNHLKSMCYFKKNITFISHFDSDHIKKYKKLNIHLGFTEIFVPHLNPKTKTAKRFFEYFNQQHTKIVQLERLKKFYDELELSLIEHAFDHTENSKSMVLLLKTNNKRILLTGDLPQKFEPPFSQTVDILKIAHHGSKSSTSENMLDKLKAKTCIISVGKNTYGHPHNEVLQRLYKFNCAPMRTDLLQNIVLNF